MATLTSTQVFATSPGTSDAAGVTVNAYVRVSATVPVTITYDYNVSSLIRNSTGNFTMNFSSPVSSSNFTFFGSAAGANRNGQGIQSRTTISATFNVYSGGTSSTLFDPGGGSWGVLGD